MNTRNVSQKGLVEELSEGGFTAFGLEDGDKKFDFSFSKDHVDPDVGAVVVGFDREFNYRKLARASSYVRYNPGCLFLATNWYEDFILLSHGVSHNNSWGMYAAMQPSQLQICFFLEEEQW